MIVGCCCREKGEFIRRKRTKYVVITVILSRYIASRYILAKAVVVLGVVENSNSFRF